MIIAATAVHTTGINWESLAVIFGGFAAIATLLIGWIDRRQARIRGEITDSVNHLSEVLLAKLETKDAVAKISERLARLEGAASGHHEGAGI